MDGYTATEVAYKNGYDDGYAAGFTDGSQLNTLARANTFWKLNGDNAIECAYCGWVNPWYLEFFPYCPKCGSKMEESLTAEINSKKCGRWERRGFNGHNCSCCGALNDIDTNYCPNCGADMRVEDNATG